LSELQEEYDAVIIDTSMYDAHGLRLEKGLLGKLTQFRKSPIDLLIPDVVKNEVQTHLEKKIKSSRSSLEKALNDAADHLFFEGSSLNDAKELLIDSKEIEELANSRINNFIDNCGVEVLECGEYVSVSEVLDQYFSNQPPFAETGKKKNEFPDAIILLAVEKWAENENKTVLAIARDGDWEKYCENSTRIDYTDDFSSGLSIFNQANAPYALLANLETALEKGTAQSFLSKISDGLEKSLDGFTPDQEADSHLYWEPDGSHGWFKDFYLIDNEFRVVDADEGWVVLEAMASISVEAEGDFSLSVYDSMDKDYVYMGSISASAKEEFESEILITVMGDLNGDLDNLDIEEIEIVNPISSIDFGTIEPDYGEYD